MDLTDMSRAVCAAFKADHGLTSFEVLQELLADALLDLARALRVRPPDRAISAGTAMRASMTWSPACSPVSIASRAASRDVPFRDAAIRRQTSVQMAGGRAVLVQRRSGAPWRRAARY